MVRLGLKPAGGNDLGVAVLKWETHHPLLKHEIGRSIAYK
jgi:hypothetical protein